MTLRVGYVYAFPGLLSHGGRHRNQAGHMAQKLARLPTRHTQELVGCAGSHTPESQPGVRGFPSQRVIPG